MGSLVKIFAVRYGVRMASMVCFVGNKWTTGICRCHCLTGGRLEFWGCEYKKIDMICILFRFKTVFLVVSWILLCHCSLHALCQWQQRVQYCKFWPLQSHCSVLAFLNEKRTKQHTTTRDHSQIMHPEPGVAFKYVSIFTSEPWGNWSNLTCA